jgi:hypothetical protein
MEKQIERYLTGKMSDEEAQDFERELANDAVLRKKVEVNRTALKAIRLEGRKRLKNRFSNLDNGNIEHQSAKKKEGISPPYLILLGILLISSLFLLFKPNDKSESTQTLPTIESVTIDTIETSNNKSTEIPEKTEIPPTHKEVIKSPPKKERPIAKTAPKTSGNRVLFAQNFEPYHHPSMRPNVRGQGDLSPREQFESAYWEKDFTQVLVLWDSLSTTQQNNGNLLFLKAVSLMEQGSIKKANEDFEQLITQKRHRFKQHSEWYLALAAIHENDTTKAKNSLTQITKNSNHQFYQSALDLLNSMN